MKKTLIALAVLAASGASFAQSSVTLSGKLGYGVQAAKGKAAGMAVTDGDIVFTAVEDLGGGLKATVNTAMLLRGRESAAAQVEVPGAPSTGVGATSATDKISSFNFLQGRDASVTLSGSFGSVMIGAVEAGNGILGLGMGGAPVSLAEGLDSKSGVVSAASNVNIMSWTSTELTAGLKMSISRIDGINNFYGTKETTANTLTNGDAISTNNDYRGSVQANIVGATYSAGPLAVAADVTDYNTGANRTRFSASYDLGVAKIGAGFENKQGTADQRVIGLSAPLGALTLGVATAVNGTKKGTVYGAQYAFSKTTNFNVSVGDYSGTSFDGSQWRARILKSF